MYRLLAVSLIAYAGAATAAPDIFSFGDPAQGKALYEKKCAACRPDRRIHTPAALLAQVQGCNQRTRAGLSAEDEQSIAAWLNQRYYKFK